MATHFRSQILHGRLCLLKSVVLGGLAPIVKEPLGNVLGQDQSVSKRSAGPSFSLIVAGDRPAEPIPKLQQFRAACAPQFPAVTQKTSDSTDVTHNDLFLYRHAGLLHAHFTDYSHPSLAKNRQNVQSNSSYALRATPGNQDDSAENFTCYNGYQQWAGKPE